jgi:hypothetical protein
MSETKAKMGSPAPIEPPMPHGGKAGDGAIYKKCEYKGCQREATKTLWWLDEFPLKLCDEHYEVKAKENEKLKEEEIKRKEEKEKIMRKIEEVIQLLKLKDDEINFEWGEVGEDDDAHIYVKLGRRVPEKVFNELLKAKAIFQINFDGIRVWAVNEEKATPILQKYYKVISLQEWEHRVRKAREYLEQAGIPGDYLFAPLWWLEEKIGELVRKK